jgi:hypothetical protein
LKAWCPSDATGPIKQAVEALGQGEEPEASGDGSGDGSVRVTRPQKITFGEMRDARL